MNPVNPSMHPKQDSYSQPISREARFSAPPILEKDQQIFTDKPLPLTPERRKAPPLPPRENRSDDHSSRESILQAELDETRMRANQMEKTMKWWADCTNQWRSKWTKKHAECKKIKDEYKKLRSKYDKIKEDRKVKTELSNNSSCDVLNLNSSNTGKSLNKDDENLDKTSKSSLKSLEDLPADSMSKRSKSHESQTDSSKSSSKSEVSSDTKNCNERSVSQLKKKCSEMEKIIESNQREREILTMTINTLQKDLVGLKQKFENLKQQRLVDNEGININLEEKDNKTSQFHEKKEISEEDIESEKIALEKQNKVLLNEITILKDEMEKRVKSSLETLEAQLQTLNNELNMKTKEISEINHSKSKLEASLQDKTEEIELANKKSDQFETEVKHLRIRIDELKIELTQSHTDVDMQSNQVRRLQTTNDELQVQIEHLQVQVKQLESRIVCGNISLHSSRSSSLKGFTTTSTEPSEDEVIP